MRQRGGAASDATKLVRECEPSQNGFIDECPQRQSATARSGATVTCAPVGSISVIGPMTRSGPLGLHVMVTGFANPASSDDCSASSESTQGRTVFERRVE